MQTVNPPRRFKCLVGKGAIYVPSTDHDVMEMLKHPEYVEVDADGVQIRHFEDGVQRIPLSTAPLPQRPTLKLPKGRRK